MTDKRASLLFLGTGGSMGVPVVGCPCGVCHSSSPYNKRLRPSALITTSDISILIDPGPDFRHQALTYEIHHIDGVIFTHAHHDHTAGIDDLRVYYLWTRKPLPCLASRATSEDLQHRYQYIFSGKDTVKKLVSKLEMQVLEKDRGVTEFLGKRIRYFSYEQAGMQVNGFCFGNLGFVSDIKQYPKTIFEDLKGVEILVLSALRDKPSDLHFTIEDAIQFSQLVGAKKTWLTHIAHEVDHDTVTRRLPSNVCLAYDGLAIDFIM